MKKEFKADFQDGGRDIKVSLSQKGVSFRVMRSRDGKVFFVPYDVIYRLAVKLDTWGEKK